MRSSGRAVSHGQAPVAWWLVVRAASAMVRQESPAPSLAWTMQTDVAAW
jgi:hypothetical protein